MDQKETGYDNYDEFADKIADKINRREHTFISRLRDNVEKAITTAIVWGSIIVVGWSVAYVYIGKGDIQHVEEAAIIREAKIAGKTEELQIEINDLKQKIAELSNKLENTKTTASTTPIIKPRTYIEHQKDTKKSPNAAQHSWDYVDKHSKRYGSFPGK